MQIEKRLSEIWASDYINTLPAQVKERGFYSVENNRQMDLLFAGFNPSYYYDESANSQFDFLRFLINGAFDKYFGVIKNMVEGLHINAKTAYLDLFYFREKQEFLREQLLPNTDGIKFLVKQLNLMQHIIEEIVVPKLIIVVNQEASAYWGKCYDEKGWVWMGYKFQFIQKKSCGELYKITGLIDSEERIAPEFKTTNLENSYVLFTQTVGQEKSPSELPSPAVIKTLLDCYDAEKKVRELRS
jgi:hypothetical protein